MATDPGFKVTVLFIGKYLKAVHIRDKKVTTGNDRQAVEWYHFQ